VVLDGFGWKLLSTECDYHEVDLRIRRELFPDAMWLKE
jgi:hypothetical protein